MESASRRGELIELYRMMLRIRAFEDAAEAASQGGVAAWGQKTSAAPARVRGPLHLSTGQEAVAAGVCANLRRSDLITSTHRGHGHTLAKGAHPYRMMAELFGRADGYNRGKGGSMHIADFSVGMLGANGVVAAGMPIAVGAAHAIKLQHGDDRIVACFFGDGAINRGPFLETFNWAKVYQLPVLFVCEDNAYAATTRSSSVTAGEGVCERARGIGIDVESIDGNDVEAVDDAAARLTESIRRGFGPLLLHARTYRFKGHVSVDPGTYREQDEVDQAMCHDPIILAMRKLSAQAVQQAVLDQIKQQADQEMADALARANEAAWPLASDAYLDVQTSGAGQWF